MTSTRRLPRAAMLLALALACETGNEVRATVTVPAEVAAAYSPSTQGLLLVRFRSEGADAVLREGAVLCGDAGTFTVSDFGDGGLSATTIDAWIEPVDGRACGPLAGDPIEEDAPLLGADEPQARAMIEGGRGGCEGNTATVSLELALP
ncbi:MAG: hypothetical protein R3B09_09140 [Nannocystaceae bacterium]